MSAVASPHPEQQALLAELAAAMRESASVPPQLLAAADATLTWRTVDADLVLAELVFDSACDPAPAGATRSGSSVRTLAFHGRDIALEIEVSRAGIAGQVIPADGGQVTGLSMHGVFDRAPIDETGCFVLGAPPPGPIRLRVDTGARRVGTCWVRLARASG
jgi:hypothetical protein